MKKGRDSKVAYMERIPPEQVSQFGFHRGSGNLPAAMGQGLEWINQAASVPTTPMSRAANEMVDSLAGIGMTKKITDIGKYRKSKEMTDFFNKQKDIISAKAKESKSMALDYIHNLWGKEVKEIGSKLQSPKGNRIEILSTPFWREGKGAFYKVRVTSPTGESYESMMPHNSLREFKPFGIQK